jgi:hypothetical protein
MAVKEPPIGSRWTGRCGAQRPHISFAERKLRDAAFWAIRDVIFERKVTVHDVYPRIRGYTFSILRRKSPDLLSLTALLRFSEILKCEQRVLDAINEVRAHVAH